MIKKKIKFLTDAWKKGWGGGVRSQPTSYGTPPEITSNKAQDKTSLNTSE